ncbi:LOW QUALITY PROTEIN: uncharacterized protein LOC121245903 [Juglans microcarpa x Juglans regia]|uniref:LOW QUALITY PROTEIN: uncharacterized protein LOC121245903 n=1 Tax=Juglans microcarpa x Juglans regia TaxID=2249226 RepID=UPI001B7DBCE9|nr:LOW QUALITY PROTEIN: uncharacterized protein LOC121245903 [Juglans microcarpa x Juglans regia]
MSTILAPFQLLELNLISAQDLANVSRSMRTYAVAWVHQDRKLSTRVDSQGDNNPTWNDKFVFRVDDAFLHSDTSAVMIEIYALHWFRDVHVGTVRVLVGNLIPNLHQSNNQNNNQAVKVGMRFVALQVRRPSGRPQGILNIGVGILNSSMRSMPLYSQLNSSAVGYRHLMGEEDSHLQGNGSLHTAVSKPSIRRTKSDTSSMIASDLRTSEFRAVQQKSNLNSSSMVNGSEVGPKKKKIWSKASSLISGSEVGRRRKNKNKIEYSSIISGSEVYGMEAPNMGKLAKPYGRSSSVISGSEVGWDPTPKKGREKASNGRPSSVHSSSEVAAEVYPTPKRVVLNANPVKEIDNSSESEVEKPKVRLSTLEKSGFDLDFGAPRKATTPMHPRMTPSHARATPKHPRATPVHPRASATATPMRAKSFHKFNGLLEYATPRRSTAMEYATTPRRSTRAFLTESELGPSPSEVAAEMAKVQRLDEEGSSIIGGAPSMDESVEGLQSKLERWRTELPPVFDRGNEFSSIRSSENRHSRRNTDSGNGLFSCFSNICGCQCQIVCGGDHQQTGGSTVGSRKKGSASERIRRNSSADNVCFI